MSVISGPNIVKDNLICLLDSANIKSYPGSGNTWTDLSGNNNNATLSNTTYNSTTKAIYFSSQPAGTGTMSISSINLSSTNNTVMYLSRQTTSGAQQRVLNAISNNWLLGYWNGYSSQYYAEGWVAGAGGAAAETAWSMYTGTGNITTDQWTLWKNQTKVVTNSNGGVQGPNGLCINVGGYGGYERSDCEVSLILVYNRVLTDVEIVQNFNALRGRYSL